MAFYRVFGLPYGSSCSSTFRRQAFRCPLFALRSKRRVCEPGVGLVARRGLRETATPWSKVRRRLRAASLFSS
jgi:hypothetical protein